MSVLVSFALAAIVAGGILRPFLFPRVYARAAAVSPEQRSLLDQKERCIQVLRDLELDFATHKISSTDYEKTRSSLTRELAGLVVRLSNVR